MPRYSVTYDFRGCGTDTIEAGSVQEANAAIEARINRSDFHIDADDFNNVDFTVRELHPITRAGREMWTTYVQAGDTRGHASALKETPLFAGVK